MSKNEGDSPETRGNIRISVVDNGKTLDVNGKKFPNLTVFRERAEKFSLFADLYGTYDSEELPVLFDSDAWRFSQEYFSESSYVKTKGQEGRQELRSLEDGGVLFGHFKTDPNTQRDYVEVLYVLPLPHLVRKPAAVTFTTDSYSYQNKIRDLTERFEGLSGDKALRAVGWPHTHPEYGPFLSGQDAFVNVFWQDDKRMIAMVIDPRQKTDLTPEIGVFSKLGKGEAQSSDPEWKKHRGVWVMPGLREVKTFTNKQLLNIEEIAEIRDQIILEASQAEKEAEWQPKVRPAKLVFRYVAEVLGSLPKGAPLPVDIRTMLSAWLGSSDEEAKNLVKGVLEKYGGLPQIDMSGRYSYAIFNFINERITAKTITEKELMLITPWLDCPRKYNQDLTLGNLAKKVIDRGTAIIKEREKPLTPKPPEKISVTAEKKEIKPFKVEYAGASSRGGRPDTPDEDSYFYPGKLGLAEMSNNTTDQAKAERLSQLLIRIGVDRTSEQILAVASKAEVLMKEGKFQGLYIVADGAGGMGSGDTASAFATYIASEFIVNGIASNKPVNSVLVEEAIRQGNSAVWNYNEKLSRDSATTMVLAVVDNQGRAFIGNVGDSRAYLLKAENSIQRLTSDHSVVEQLAKAGDISYKDTYTHPLRNRITRVLGRKEVGVDTYSIKLVKGETLILCCDGVWEGFPPSEGQTTLSQCQENLRQAVMKKTPEQIVNTLTSAVVGQRSGDNLSAIAVRLN